MMHNGPDWLKYLCSAILICYALYAGFRALQGRMQKMAARQNSPSA